MADKKVNREMFLVVLSGVVIGRAADWKQAEYLVWQMLRARGRIVPSWDETCTRETDSQFEFVLSSRF
jgi:hypothetical protein